MFDLLGERILVVEDEAVLALELSMSLQAKGAEVAGPCMCVEDALSEPSDTLSGAILDVDLHGVAIFPVADELRKKGVPFVFHTGRSDISHLTRRYRAPVFAKPSPTNVIFDGLRHLMGDHKA